MLCGFVSSRPGRTNDRSKRKECLQLINALKLPQRMLVRDAALSEFTSQDGNRTRTPLYGARDFKSRASACFATWPVLFGKPCAAISNRGKDLRQNADVMGPVS